MPTSLSAIDVRAFFSSLISSDEDCHVASASDMTIVCRNGEMCDSGRRDRQEATTDERSSSSETSMVMMNTITITFIP